MKKSANIVLAILLGITLALGAFQGRRVTHLRESELFYRWILAETTRSRVFDDAYEGSVAGSRREKRMDRELLEEICDTAEGVLPDIALGKEDYDKDGVPLEKLTIAVRDEQDQVVWRLASGAVLSKQRGDFLRYLREKRLSSVASEFDPEAIYSQEGIGVSLGNIMFGFRMLAANFVWMQVDKYWHQGAIHRMLPLMKTCVTLDPHFVDAYQIGAWHLAYNITAHMLDTPEPLKKWHPKYKVRIGEKELYYYLAIDYLRDGIWKNPRNYKLYFDLGFAVYKLKLKDYANAVKCLSEAIRYRHDRWVPRQLYICLELNGQYEEALMGWQDYLAKDPGHEVAQRFIKRNRGLIKEKNAERAAERAKQAKDPAKAGAALAEAEKLRAEARAIWESMVDAGGNLEPFAAGRIMRMKALRLIEEERYLEAIAILEHARFESNALFEEASNIIIDTKLKAGLPLSVSEKKAVLRQEEAEKYKNLPPPESDS